MRAQIGQDMARRMVRDLDKGQGAEPDLGLDGELSGLGRRSAVECQALGAQAVTPMPPFGRVPSRPSSYMPTPTIQNPQGPPVHPSRRSLIRGPKFSRPRRSHFGRVPSSKN